jgi:hypothetical protein
LQGTVGAASAARSFVKKDAHARKETWRLKIAEALPGAETLVKEMLDFQVWITVAGHDVYGAWREGTHDDLVLTVALASWWAECAPGRISASWERFVASIMQGAR